MLPYQLNAFLYISHFDLFYLDECCMISFYMGLGMFFARASETEFYGRLTRFLANLKKSPVNLKSLRSSMAESSIGPRDSEAEEHFFDPSAPLTNSIQKTINLEFMCCILYGLSEIFAKQERRFQKTIKQTLHKKKKDPRLERKSVEIDIRGDLIEGAQEDTDPLSRANTVVKKDFTRAKSHSIYYNKIYDNEENDEINLDKMKVKITSQKTIEDTPRGSVESNFLNQEPLMSESSSSIVGKSKKQDAHIIEYCPKIFLDLRQNDEIDPFALEK